MFLQNKANRFTYKLTFGQNKEEGFMKSPYLVRHIG